MTPDEKRVHGCVAKALNAIYNGVDENQFRLISTCSTAKEAWDILANTYEGNTAVKSTKLIGVQIDFEQLRMEESENITEFYGRLRDIINQAFQLGKVYTEEELVRKIVGALPKRFYPKIAALELMRDYSRLRVDELMGILETWEMAYCEGQGKGSKS